MLKGGRQEIKIKHRVKKLKIRKETLYRGSGKGKTCRKLKGGRTERAVKYKRMRKSERETKDEKRKRIEKSKKLIVISQNHLSFITRTSSNPHIC